MTAVLAKAGKVDLLVADPTEEELTAFNPMKNSALCDNKIRNLGYKETFSVEEGLTHTVKILKEIKSK